MLAGEFLVVQQDNIQKLKLPHGVLKTWYQIARKNMIRAK